MSFEPISQAGILHNYAIGLVAFELNPPTVPTPDRNTLLFIGGLGTGLYTVPYVPRLAKSIEGWSVVEVLTSSSYKGWGSGSLKRDAEELTSCVAYFRKMRPDGRVVLLGSSTGCQDAMEYVTNLPDDKPKLDGAILQAPVSDREAVVNILSEESYLASLSFCKSWIDEGKGEEVIPIEYRSLFQDYPVSAQRWYSLIAPLGPDGKPQGADDYFSSNISEEVMTAIFAKIKADTKLLFLISGNDQFVPESVDKEALLRRWFRAAAAAGAKVDTENSAVVAGANHTYNDVPDEAFENFRRRVVSFLEGLETCK